MFEKKNQKSNIQWLVYNVFLPEQIQFQDIYWQTICISFRPGVKVSCKDDDSTVCHRPE